MNPLSPPILGHETDFAMQLPRRDLCYPALTVPQNRPIIDWIQTNHRSQQFGASGSEQPPETNDFASANFKGNVLENAGSPQSAHLEQRLALRCGWLPNTTFPRRYTEHEMHHFGRVDLGDRRRPQRLTIPHYGHSLAD